jgi:hypothetical protein
MAATPFPAPSRAVEDPRIRIVRDELRDQVDGQLRQIQAADAKAGILVALSGAFLVAVLASSPDFNAHGATVLLAQVLISGVISLAYAFVALWPKEWRRDPNPTTLVSNYETNVYPDGDALLLQLVSNLRTNFQTNEPVLRAKVRQVRLSQFALGAQLVSGLAFGAARWVTF